MSKNLALVKDLNLRVYLHVKQALDSGVFTCTSQKKYIEDLADQFQENYLAADENDDAVLIAAGIIAQSNQSTVSGE